MNNKTAKRITLGLSIGLLLTSLTQKCYCTTGLCGDSLAVFIFGIFGIFSGGATICWLANPLLLLSWIFIKKNKVSLLLSLVSTLLAFSFLLFDEVIDTEAGHYRKIIGYKIGYWLWVGSSLAMLLGNLIIKFILPQPDLT